MESSYSNDYLHLWRNHWWWRSRHALVLHHVRKSLKLLSATGLAETPLILDIGCAGGVAFDDLSAIGEVYGIEPDSTMAHSLPQWSDRVETIAFTAGYLAAREYDLILMLDVLEHIDDDQGALGALFGCLKPGGCAIITVPAFQFLWSTHDIINHHFRRYRRTTLRERLLRAGFAIHELKYFFAWSLGLVFLRKFIASRPDKYSVRVPPSPINSLFAALSHCEWWMMNHLRLRWPAGSSVLALIQRPTG